MYVKIKDKSQRIIDAAILGIAESGFHNCQISKIASLAGVSVGTIYLYFENKEKVIIRVAQERIEYFIEKMRREISQVKTTEECLRVIVRTHFSYMEQNRSWAIVVYFELRQLNPKLRLIINSLIANYFSLVEGVIKRGIKCGEVPKIDTQVARQMILGTLDRATVDWLIARSPRTLMSGIEPVLALFNGALGLKKCKNII
ncbi:transcriptional regulator [Desulfosporosinus orientis DSM 765]|uniref:Transcriptional regulator n=1 Tax=Desulfosporosinus orientis (strain ATCC 19365 / DSM 765 / NCIMB 8382 / VKM B-1628 / Singapore I) TaxID=768706 RepID=G7WGS1_DESOD|nr:TetR/AcrR family transcriptional regulator C-terminal domain-containing protein [Desulfosporosinus orientis]AET68507.1 transcriptional regulator [Desulfosporosinus orientis DSM 765]